MLALTDRAVDAARRALTEANQPAAGIRITAEGGGCHGPRYSLELDDNADEGDETLEFGGIKVFVAPAILESLEGTSLDFAGEGEEASFVFNSPKKAKGGCGCGGGGHG